MAKGYIYILTNPSFKEWVKIGYADDPKKRLDQLNRTECTPFAFRIYATYEVDNRLQDKKVHDIIDSLNPTLRSRDSLADGKVRVREFYNMSAEEAYKLFESIAQINGLEKNLKKYSASEEEAEEEALATKARLSAFRFSMCNIKPGEEVVFLDDPSIVCTVIDDKRISYNGEDYSLSGLAGMLLHVKAIQGPLHFTYKGKVLADLRRELHPEDYED